MIRRTLAAAAAYLGAACLFTWPLVLHPRALFGAADVAGDASLNLWALGWDLRVITGHPLWLLTGRVFDAGIFYPAPRTLAFSDNLLVQALAVSPAWIVTHDLVLCYNLLLFGSLVAAALSMHLLARALTGSEKAAFVAGLIFGFAPYHFAHLGHVQLQALYFMPLSFLLLHRLFAADRTRDTLLLGIVVGLQAVSSMYYGIIGGLGVLVAAVTLLLVDRRAPRWPIVRRLAAAAVIAIVVALPWSIPYVLVHRDTGAGRTLGDAGRGGAALTSYLQAPPTNLLYGRTGWLRPGPGQRLPFREGPEQELLVGFTTLLLAVAGVAAATAATRKAIIVYSAVAVAGLLLSLGPDAVGPLYSLLYKGLFGMAAIRAPVRFGVLVLCGLAVLAALAVKTIELRSARSTWLFTAAVLAIGLEFSNGAVAYPAPPPVATAAGQWLRQQPGSGAVVCAPMRVWLDNTPCMLQSLEHRRPVVNGYSGIVPPFFEAMVDVVSRLPDPESLLALHNIGVQYVVSDAPLVSGSPLDDVLVERTHAGSQWVYELQWSDEIEARVRARVDVPPPDPGPVPFETGEAATYRLRWTSGPLDVPAGQATISVVPSAAGASYAFRVDASTASWVSRFYQAVVTLTATTDPRLLPLSYAESIDEGKRKTERQLAFDPARHEVRIASGGTSIVLPVGIGARDPISTLFYLRTLPLGPGASFTVPISDNGRRLKMDVTVAGRETILLDGQRRDVWRLEPRISERIDRDPLGITAWVSADDRKVPLVVDVRAQFGTARLELTGYRPGGSGGS